jgi:parvulin-like peptidyl-prolyl isomerase
LLGALLALGSACTPAPGDPVIIAFAGQEVRRSEFDRHLAQLASAGQLGAEAEVRRAVYEDFVEKRLLALSARARGLLRPGASAAEEAKAVHALLDHELSDKVRVGEAEIAARFSRRPPECVLPETVTLRQVLVATSNEARDVRRRLRRDPTSFEGLARAFSRAPEAARGGLMGTFARGQLPAELEGAAFTLRPGEASEVLQTALGHHVLRLEERRPAREATADECRPRLLEALVRAKTERAYREYVSGLLSRAKVSHANL